MGDLQTLYDIGAFAMRTAPCGAISSDGDLRPIRRDLLPTLRNIPADASSTPARVAPQFENESGEPVTATLHQVAIAAGTVPTGPGA
ncbi:MAG: hypothetical protein ACRENE_02295, partial [Polyangiaceae bacterium]